MVKTEGKAWKIEMRDGEIYIGRQNSFYDGFWFELGFLSDGDLGLKHKRWNGKKGRLPRFPKYIVNKLKEIGFTKFQHTDGIIHYL